MDNVVTMETECNAAKLPLRLELCMYEGVRKHESHVKFIYLKLIGMEDGQVNLHVLYMLCVTEMKLTEINNVKGM